jgi:hypothetical protein
MSDECTTQIERNRQQILERIKELTSTQRGRNEDLILESISRKLQDSTKPDFEGPITIIPYLKNALRNKLQQVEEISNLMAAVSSLAMVHAALEDRNNNP